MASIIDENTQFLDSAGTPIVNGYLYVGTANLDPVTNTITIYSDSALSVPLSNPQRTDAYGRSTNKIYVPGEYSIKCEDESNVQQYLELYNGTAATAAEQIKISSNDTTAGYLNGKLTAGTNVTLTENNNGANEDLEIDIGAAGILIDESADHNNTPVAGKGEVWIKNDAPNTLSFTDDAGTDFSISPPPQATNHIRAGNIQLWSGSAAISGLAADSVITELTFESVGPTGSGADNIWDDMDNMPSTARAVIVRIQATVDVGAASTSVQLHSAHGDVGAPVANSGTYLWGVTWDFDAATGTNIAVSGDLFIPVNSSQLFELRWNVAGETSIGALTLYYRGFVTD